MQDLHNTYTSRGRKPGARPGGVSRSRTEPLAPKAKGPAASSTLTPVRACQPSGILKNTAPVPVPIPTAPQAPEPSRPQGVSMKAPTREALIKSLFAFILEFLCNARNGLTRIASYLRSPMTKQYIKILIKADSMN